jgi:hypothetical protein
VIIDTGTNIDTRMYQYSKSFKVRIISKADEMAKKIIKNI